MHRRIAGCYVGVFADGERGIEDQRELQGAKED